MLSIFTLGLNGYAQENNPTTEGASSASRHSPYISYDISREEAGIGYRYKRNLFMYDFNGTYKFMKFSWTDIHLMSLSFHVTFVSFLYWSRGKS